VKTRFVGFDALKRSVSMVQLLDRYGLLEELHRSRDNLSGACPIHSGHNRTQFRVSTSRNCWICFGDGNGGGSIIDFVIRKEGLGIRDAALLIQDLVLSFRSSFSMHLFMTTVSPAARARSAAAL